MQPALIAAIVAAVGWFATYFLTRRAAAAGARRDAALHHLECQLGELYGPLAFLVIEGQRVFADLVEDFGETWAVGGRVLEDAEVDQWLFWVDRYFMPRNERIQELLSTKAHLIEGARIPDSYVAFVGHHSTWKLDHLRWKEQEIRERLYSRRRWPVEFAEDVLETFATLKQRHADLLGDRLSMSEAGERQRRTILDAPPRGVDEWAAERGRPR